MCVCVFPLAACAGYWLVGDEESVLAVDEWGAALEQADPANLVHDPLGADLALDGTLHVPDVGVPRQRGSRERERQSVNRSRAKSLSHHLAASFAFLLVS